MSCYCESVRPFRTSGFDLIFLQHPHERKRTVGTARMAHLCLENSKIFTGMNFDHHRQVEELIHDPANYCMVLYPGPRAINVSLQGAAENRALAPAGKKLVIFLIDGTWSCAKKMIKCSPNIMSLPQICFTPYRGSEYQFRRQPLPNYVSTIEATYQLLEILEPSPQLGQLLELFRAMVARQVEQSKKHVVRSLRL